MRTILDWNKIRVLGNICDEQTIEDFETSNSIIELTEEKYENQPVLEMYANQFNQKIGINIDCNATNTFFNQNDNITLKFHVTEKKTGKPVHDKSISVYYDAGTKYEPDLVLIGSGKLNNGDFTLSYYEESFGYYDIVVEISDSNIQKKQRFTVRVLTELILYLSETAYNYVYEVYEEDNLNNLRNKLDVLVKPSYKDKKGNTVFITPDTDKRYVIDKSNCSEGKLYWNKEETRKKGYYGGSVIIKLTKADYYISYSKGKNEEGRDGKTVDTAFKTIGYCIKRADKSDDSLKTIYITDYPADKKDFDDYIEIKKNYVLMGDRNDTTGWYSDWRKQHYWLAWFHIKPKNYLIIRNFGFRTKEGEEFYFNRLTIYNAPPSDKDIVVDGDYIREAAGSTKQPSPTPVQPKDVKSEETETKTELVMKLESNVNEVIFRQNEEATVTAVVTDEITNQPVKGAWVKLKTPETEYNAFTTEKGVATFRINITTHENNSIFFSAGLEEETYISNQKFMLKIRKQIHIFARADEYNVYLHICAFNKEKKEIPVICTLRYINNNNKIIDVPVNNRKDVTLSLAELDKSRVNQTKLIYDTNEYFDKGVEDGKDYTLLKVSKPDNFVLYQGRTGRLTITLHDYHTNNPLAGIKCVINVFGKTVQGKSDVNGNMSLDLTQLEPSDFNVHYKFFEGDKLVSEMGITVRVRKKLYCKVIRTDTHFGGLVYLKDGKGNTVNVADDVSILWTNQYGKQETGGLVKGVFAIRRDNIKDDDYQNIRFGVPDNDSYYFDNVFDYEDRVTPDIPADDPIIREDIKTDVGKTEEVGRNYFTVGDFINASSSVVSYIRANNKVPTSVSVYGKEFSFARYLNGAIQSFTYINGTDSNPSTTVNKKIATTTESIENDNMSISKYNHKLSLHEIEVLAREAWKFYKNNSYRFPNNISYPRGLKTNYKIYAYAIARSLEFFGAEGRLPYSIQVNYPFS